MEVLFTADGLVSLFTLTMMEIILGIDNIVFISIVVSKLPEHQQPRARTLGLGLALIFRILLLLSISWLVGLTDPVLTLSSFVDSSEHMPFAFSWRDFILIGGGLFLMGKTILEMHHKLEGEDESGERNLAGSSFLSIVLQIIALDVVFSFDSILTAVGLVREVEIMIAAVIISMGVMIAASGAIARFINSRPTMKILALSFLLLIGFMLIAEGFDQHIDKGYIYFAMAFSFGVEILNGQLRRRTSKPVQLRERYRDDAS